MAVAADGSFVAAWQHSDSDPNANFASYRLFDKAGNGKNVQQQLTHDFPHSDKADNLYNSISKGSAYYVDDLREEAKSVAGYQINAKIRMENESQAADSA